MSIAIVFRYQKRENQKQDELPRHATKGKEMLNILVSGSSVMIDIVMKSARHEYSGCKSIGNKRVEVSN